MNQRPPPSTDEMMELLQRIVTECRHPARLIELYYWSAEPALAEIMRQYIVLPDNVQAALYAFFALVAEDPHSVSLRITGKGEMVLSSPLAAELTTTLAQPNLGPPGVH